MKRKRNSWSIIWGMWSTPFFHLGPLWSAEFLTQSAWTVEYFSAEGQDRPQTSVLYIIFTNSSAWAGYDARSIFKRSLNSEFFLLQGWRIQSALLFTHNWRENNWIHNFPKGISAMWNAMSRPGFELVSPCPFPTTITITPRASPHECPVYDTKYLLVRFQ